MSRIENVIPILRVEDLVRSIEYYTRVLGFQVDWQDGGMASVSRDGHGLMLCEGAQGNPGTWVWIGVEDAEALATGLRERGAHIVLEPTNYTWALEMRVENPDGHILRFGSEPRDDRPFVK